MLKLYDKFNEKNFNFWKFKINMGLASVDLWGIMDEFEVGPPFNVAPRVRKKYQMFVKMVMSIIVLN